MAFISYGVVNPYPAIHGIKGGGKKKPPSLALFFPKIYGYHHFESDSITLTSRKDHCV